MGNCNSVVTPDSTDPTSKTLTKSIDAQLQAAYDKERQVIKCLLLGAGECGKSTILKQMKILHLNGFSSEEKKNYKTLIWKNTIESIQTLCTACDTLAIHYDTPANKQLAVEVKTVNANDLQAQIQSNSMPQLATAISTLWADKGVQRAFARSNEFHLLDSASYFLKEVNRVFTNDYIPIDQDILRSRVATTGIIQTDFSIDKLSYKMYDVGGQRGERKKWIHCFENVTAIMFIASLSEYDQVLAEDRTRNRLKESLDLFEGIINLPWFSSSPIILFLNKNDIFTQKIASSDPGVYFPFYTGGCNYSAGLQFIQDLYFERNDNTSKTIYCHVTDATNTENIEFVWKCTKHIILEQNLTTSGLMMV